MVSWPIFDNSMASNLPLGIVANVDLQSYNTLRVPVVAEWFAEVHHFDQLVGLLNFQSQQQCPLLVLGGGSNLLLPETLSGLVLRMATKGVAITEETADTIVVTAAAGESWHELVMWSVKQGYYGLENLALIPGSVGAAPIQNIGAYGVELERCFEYLDGMDISSGEIQRLDRQACQFGYRDSIFKRQLQDKFIITSVSLRLQKIPQLVLDYPALQQAFATLDKRQLTAKQVAAAVIAIRQSKLPDPQHIPNAGSFFKNPIVTAQRYTELQHSFPDVVAYPLDSGDYKVAAGWLLDKAGWRGKMINGLGMHAQQALVLTNPNQYGAKRLLDFVEQLRESIQQQFRLELEIEPRVIV